MERRREGARSGRCGVARWAAGLLGLTLATAGQAQERGAPATLPDLPAESVFDGDFITVGIGVARSPSYSGSDDYVFTVLPLVQGRVGGIGISPRPAGLALDLLPDDDTGPQFALGPVIRLNRDRVRRIEDPVVAAYGRLDTAVEVGPSVGIAFPAVLNPFDRLSVSVDVVWDVAGAHRGSVVSPSVSYFTPLSRGAAASLSVGANRIDDDYARYYYSVPTAAPGVAGQTLAPFAAQGGWESVNAGLLGAVDLDGDLTNGGFSLVGIGAYTRLAGSARRTPFTSVRGSADQWLLGLGVGYTF
ncbi:MipA/OmpV family protein [Erythrobacteraceae bacterium CFH 75059]|uniref:MipA/OmpV family protein n=1 Tax=Qipengyuania thermophila TaxID=2509361 RepID=UPI00101FF7C2|nr:MipA/OmpV family protein [Qipengyuania thermophila]TCD04847.1 MipA/OmpV family protein [Erythrobacteraceae bacterium CFH 75059]